MRHGWAAAFRSINLLQRLHHEPLCNLSTEYQTIPRTQRETAQLQATKSPSMQGESVSSPPSRKPNNFRQRFSSKPEQKFAIRKFTRNKTLRR